MQIQKVNYQRNRSFGESIVLKSKVGPQLLSSLETVNIDNWSQKVNPKLCYAYLRNDKEGFYYGLLADGAEAKAMQELYKLHRSAIDTKGAMDMSLVERIVDLNTSLAASSEQVNVSSLKDLFALPMLKKAGKQTQYAIKKASQVVK